MRSTQTFSKKQEKIQKSNVLTLVSDGWSNIRNDGIIGFVVCTPEPIFYKSVPMGSERHTGENIFKLHSNLIEELGPNKIFAVVTDNATNMKLAWQMIRAKYPHILTLGCAAHSFNLLFNDICSSESLNTFLAEIKELVLFFNNQIASSILLENQTKLKKQLDA